MMGKFDFDISPEFLRTLGRMADIDRIAPKMLDAAVPVLERNIKAELQAHKMSSELINSTKKTRPVKSKNGGHLVTVRPTGTDLRGVRNMAKLAWLEYGVKRKGGGGWKQSPTPILTKALKDSEPEVYSVMRRVFESEVAK